MDEIWFEEELVPSVSSIDDLLGEETGPKGIIKRKQLEAIRGAVRVHTPRWQELEPDVAAKLNVSNPSSRYVLIRLGCEFDPRPETRKAHIGFVSAIARAILEGDSQKQPLVYDIAPAKVDQGEARNVKFSLEPSFKTAAGAEFSLGGISTELDIGTVAPITRGFPGEEERMPYWELKHHRKAPLYDLRHFWLIVEMPMGLITCSIRWMVEGTLQTMLGGLNLGPTKTNWDHRPQFIIDLSNR